MKKYELTEETKLSKKLATVFRIKALKSFGDVKAGDLGGFVEFESNLSHEGKCWIYDDAKVYDNAKVLGDAKVSGNAEVYDKGQVLDKAEVSGEAQVYDNAEISGSAKVYDKAKIFNRAEVYDKAKIFGKGKVSGNAKVYGNAEVLDKAQVYNNAKVYDEARILKGSVVMLNAQVFGNAKVSDRALSGDIKVFDNSFENKNNTKMKNLLEWEDFKSSKKINESETNESTTKLNESVASINPMIQKEIDTFLAPIIKKYELEVKGMDFSPETSGNLLTINIGYYEIIVGGSWGASKAFNKKDAEEIAKTLNSKDMSCLKHDNFQDCAVVKKSGNTDFIYFSDLKEMAIKMGIKEVDFKNFATKIKELHELAPLFAYQEIVKNHKRFKLTSEIQKKKNVYEFTYESIKNLGGTSMHANEIGKFTVFAEVGELNKVVLVFDNNGMDFEVNNEAEFRELLNDM